MKIKEKLNKKAVRKRRVKMRLKNKNNSLRLSVFKSNKYIYAQIIDDEKGITICEAHSEQIKNKKGFKQDNAKEIGKTIGKKALNKNIQSVIFDRGPYRYHGRIKALAEGAREEGLKF